jgi:hypothetical protein
MKMPVFVSMVLLSLTANAAAQQTTCKNAGQEYGVGATICECPSLKGSGRMASGGRSQITSRRLVCASNGEWKSTESLCVDIESSGGTAAEDFPKFHALYCPRPATMSAEQTEQFFETASNAQILAAMRGICRRFTALAAQCKALIDAAGR